MKNKILLIFLFYIFSCSANEDTEWWKNTQLYQIYPRSFMDSNGDGIGDIQGIVSKVSHLADIGVEAVWLSPVFESPMKDFGYDISNFTKIQDEYGTEEDLKMLLAEARKYGIRVLLDFVPNHTSDQCEWFKLSANKTAGYENYYVWHPGRPNGDGGRNLPPSNWISVFRGSAWTFHEGRGEYYLHQFLKEQPDLNFREPAVVEEMQNVLRYWLDIGVDGFRVDAIPHLVEADVDAETGFYPDEPESGLTHDSESYDFLIHTQTREREETWLNIFNWRQTMDSYSNFQSTKIIVMEAFSELGIVMQYYGNATHEGAHYPFNFEMIPLDNTANAVSLKALVDNYMFLVPNGRVTNWVVGNHDRQRLASRVGELADGIMMMNMLLPGVSVTYQGEEIGMVDQPLSWEDTMDPQACLSGKDLYNTTSRDPQRTPFQWDNSTNAGFSTGNKTWLPVADNYLELNLFNQKVAPRSTYKLYKGLSKLRRSDVIKYGEMQIEILDNEVLAFSRFIRDGDTVVVVVNTANILKDIAKLNEKFPYLQLDKNLEVVVPSVRSNWHAGEYIQVNELQLQPYESLVLKNGAMELFNISLIALFACIISMIMQIMA